MPSKIKYISYLDRGDVRQRVVADDRGMFTIKAIDSRGRTTHRQAFGARDVVTHLLRWHPLCDPVATLTDRMSVRICQGGQAPPRVEALCLLEAHDKGSNCPTREVQVRSGDRESGDSS